MNIIFLKDKLKDFFEKNRDSFEKVKEFLKKNRKKIFIYTPLSFLITFIISLIFWFGPTVGFILTVVLKPAFSIKEIYFPRDGEVLAKGVKLSYKRQVIVDAPKVILKYDLNGKVRDWIKSIDVYNSKIVIDRKGSIVNIVDAFSTGGTSKAGTGVPIGIIHAINADATYRDFSYGFPIEKHVPVVNGYVSFDKDKGIDLIFGGPYKDGDISYSFSNYVEAYSMTIKGKNLDLDTNTLQYAYYYEDVEYLSGKANLDLTIAQSGLYGSADIKDLEVRYKPFFETAKNISGHVDFLKDKIKIDADFDVFNKRKKFTLDFDSKDEMNINIILGDMSYDEVSKYKLLNNINLKWMFNDVKDLNINLKLDKNKQFFVILDSIIPKVNLGVELDNIKNRLVYTNGEMNWSVLDSEMSMSFLKDKLIANFKLKDSKGELTYTLKNIGGQVNLEFNKKRIDIDSKSGIIVGKGSYTYDSKLLNIYNTVNSEKLYNVVYDFKDFNLVESSGELDFNFSYTLNGVIKSSIQNGAGKIEGITLYNLANEEVFTSQGEIDLKKGSYNFLFDTNTFDFITPVLSEDLKLTLNTNGSVSGVGKNYNLEVDGEVVNLNYKGLDINGLKSNFRIKNGVLNIKKIGNNIINLNGDIDFSKKLVNLGYSIKDLTSEYIKLKNPNLVIYDATGKIKGNLNNPEISSSIKSGMLFLKESEGIDFSGDLLYKSKILKVSNFAFENGKSVLSGEYNFTNNKYNFNGDIFLDKISRFTLGKYFKYRVIGKLSGKGSGEKIDAKFDYTVDSIYYKGERLPNLDGKLSYNAEKLTDGILDIKYLKIMKDDVSLGFLDGKVDFKSKEIGIYLNDGEVDLQKYFKDSGINGLIYLSGDLGGTLDAPNFSFKAQSKEIEKDRWNFKNIDLSLSGDLNEIKLNKFGMIYENNLLEALGFYKFSDKSYSFNIFSKNIEIDFLNGILDKKELENIKGKAELDLKFTNKGNNGFFKGDNISFNIPKYVVEAKDFDFVLELSGNRLKIDELKGVLNSGDINAEGYLIIPKIDEIKNNPYFYEKIDYDLSLNMKGVKYEYPEHFKLTFDTDMNLASNKLIGEFIVVDGELKKIPGVAEDINILKLIADYLRKFIFSQNGKIKDKINLNQESDENFANILEMDLDFKIRDGINIDLKSVVGIVEDVKGKFLGSGKLKEKNGNINFLGSFSVNEGGYVLNNIDFVITEASIIFSKENEYYPNYNPILIFESHSRNVYENYEISLQGEIKNLNFSIRSNTGVSNGNLTSLFSGEKNKNRNNENSSSGDQSFLVANVLNSQLTNSFLKPFSETIKTVFGLSKLRITSDIGRLDNQSNSSEADLNNGSSEENRYKLGAKIQAEKHLYDKFYLVGEVGITGSNSDSTRSNDDSGSSFNKYNGGIEYRMTESKSIGIGVSKVIQENSETVNSNKNKDNEKLNYYINFLFYKKYDDFSDMLKNIF